jgi:hypothetical protein
VTYVPPLTRYYLEHKSNLDPSHSHPHQSHSRRGNSLQISDSSTILTPTIYTTSQINSSNLHNHACPSSLRYIEGRIHFVDDGAPAPGAEAGDVYYASYAGIGIEDGGGVGGGEVV